MNLAEHLQDLDPQLAAHLERALDSVRGEFEEKIAATVREAVSAAAAEAAAREVSAKEEAAAAVSAPLDAADELRLAALDIDTAKSQSEILEALTRGVLRFSSRVAIFVNRGQEVHGWSASGFGSADATIREVSLSPELPFPIGAQLSDGAVALSAEDCAAICDAIGAESPSMGMLLPFVLGAQVVGTVYCDRRSDDAFSVSALQLLTYVAGQTLETLPVRKRDSTATLALARGSATTTPVAPAESVEEKAPVSSEPEPGKATGTASEAVPPQKTEAPETASDYQFETLDEPQAGLPSAAKDEAEESMPPVVESAAEPLPPVDEESTRPGTLGAAPWTAPASPPPAPEAASTPGPSLAPEAPEVLEAPEAPPATRTPPMPDASPAPTATGATETAAEARAEEGPSAAAEPAVSLSSTQVAPPSDLQGPGWAFTGGGETSEATSETEHEEAQRLARLLVTEIKLYNEEAVEQGRRDGDVYSRLQEDIDRSRQIFEDRIDPDVRSETDYFKQALVRILAGGDPSLLGT